MDRPSGSVYSSCSVPSCSSTNTMLSPNVRVYA